MGDWSNGKYVYEDPAAHQASKVIGTESVLLLTGGGGVGTVLAKAGCVVSGASPLAALALKGYGMYQAGTGLAGSLGEFSTAYQAGDGYGMLQHGFLSVVGAVDLAAASAQQCFAAGTPLRTPEGSKPIEEFAVGDLILTAPDDDPEAEPG